MWRINSKPLTFGILKSVTTRSISTFSRVRRASGTLPAVKTVKSRFLSFLLSISMVSAESSTTSIDILFSGISIHFLFLFSYLAVNRQSDFKNTSLAKLAVNIDLSTVRGDDPVNYRESQASSLINIFCRIEGNEYLFSNLFLYSHPGIFY